VRGELKQLKEERERVDGELKDAEKKLPQDVQERYFRRAAIKKEDALSETDGNCHQTLTAQIASQLMMNHGVFCGGCGALFYLKEGVTGR